MSAKEDALTLLGSLAQEKGVPILPGVEERAIADIGNRLGLILPWDLHEWLGTCRIHDLIQKRILAIRDPDQSLDIERLLESNQELKQSGYVPLVITEFGDMYAALTGSTREWGTPVAFFDHDISLIRPDHLVALGIWAFFRFFFERELSLLAISKVADPDDDRWGEEYDTAIYWPFNKMRVLQVDPLLEDSTGAPLPWEAE